MNELDIFAAALERSPSERVAFLEEACGSDAALRQRIERLLERRERAGNSFEKPAAEILDAPLPMTPIAEKPGGTIGPYKLREEIGRGGFGVVFVAEQTTPVRRKVALKVIKPGMDTREVVARFEAERQALAVMNHPHIAKVLDAGATESGRPYFVMELVRGVPITEFCDRNRLATRQRLELFLDVCRAVQHAHQNGIIHRDLKPRNILVTLHDGKPVPKVIDFGVSKALNRHLTEKTIYTSFGQVIGTPQYMSPEQAEMSDLGVDTRTDVYSLGVVLYELLTGKTPHDIERLFASGYAEMMRIIQQEEPLRPSSKISTLGEEATLIAEHRRTDPRALGRSLRGDLDWIVLRALEKDRERRYEAANSIYADVERFLKDEAVEARPPSRVYRFKKLLRRKRTQLLTASLIAAVLLCGMAGIIWQTLRARHAEDRTRAESLVISLVSAKTRQVSALITELEPLRPLANPLLKKQFERSDDDSTAKLHTSLALLPVDTGQVDYLTRQLPMCTVEQFPVVCAALLPHSHEVVDSLWQLALDIRKPNQQRFLAAAALADYAPDDRRWASVAHFVSDYLTNSSLYFGQWLKPLRSARHHLIASLTSIHAERSNSRKQRETAALVLADYLREQPDRLADVIVLADQWLEYSPLLASLRPHAAAARARLIRHLQATMRADLSPANEELFAVELVEQRDAHWKRQALAAVTLVHLGHGDAVWPRLEFTPDPSLRSYIIRYLGEFQVDHNTLADQLDQQTKVSIRRAVIQSLGDLDVPSADRSRISERLLRLYREDPDAGIHSSASWTLRRWGVALPALPVGEPDLSEEQTQRFSELAAKLEAARRRLSDYERDEMPIPQGAWEQQLREQPPELPESLRRGLVAYYPLNEGAGLETANLVDGRPAGRYRGPGGPEWLRGVVGNAIRLDGQGGHFNLGSWFNPERTDPISFGCWFLKRTKNEFPLIGKTALTPLRGFDVRVDPNGKLSFVEMHAHPDWFQVKTRDTFDDGGWHHVFVTYDGSGTASGVKIYADGKQAVSDVIADNLTSSIRHTLPLTLGKDRLFSYSGQIDEVRIYDRVLSGDEVARLYEMPLRELASVPSANRSAAQRSILVTAFQSRDERWQELKTQVAVAADALRDARVEGLRQWYVNSQGQTMVVFPTMDSTDLVDRGRNHSFAISTHEVTVAELLRFRPEHSVDRRYAPTDDYPAVSVSWYMAAEYCNWLSEQEGYPEDQWVFEPNREGKYADGMKIRENFLDLEGYRFPTDAEWEHACRAGTRGSFCLGEPLSLLTRYSWFAGNSSGRAHRVESLLPNDAGLFDMHGNSWEWTLVPTTGPLSPVGDGMGRRVYGGAFESNAIQVGSRKKINLSPFAGSGIRPVRTYHVVPRQN